MDPRSSIPSIRTDTLSPNDAAQREQSQATPSVPPSSPSIPRLPSQVFDSPSLDISISTLLAASNTSEPAIAEKASKVIQLSQENIELSERLKQIEQRLKAIEEAEKKRGAGSST
ncbi:hypothetical protein BDV93DRAFT_10457 [Ceratobasidium sp. AG-I]|nr:hypothetical protein BDV93DRAFT_10457 [Ceratobasidium sp. AG-I]